MRTLLLLAGRSRRFWPLQEKTFFPVCGKTLLEHQIDRLCEGGCTDITLVAGPHNIEEAKRMYPDLTVVLQNDVEKGMQGALLDALPVFGDEPVLIVGGNDVVSPDAYRAILARMKKKDVDGVILAKHVERYFPGGYLTLDGEKITSIVEKPGEGNEPSEYVNIVTHAHRSASTLLAVLKKIESDRDDAYEKALDSLCNSHTYVAEKYDGPWQAVKYPWHLLSLLPMLLGDITRPQIAKTASVHPTAVIEGPVVIGEGAKILPHACIVGPAYIGAHTIVGNGALVRGSSIADHCVAGYQTEVKSSVLADHCWLHMAYCGDSVLGENVAFGAGTVTGNLRLDEGEIESDVGEQKVGTGRTKFGTIVGSHARIGIHVGINPGVKIGRDAFVSSGTLVSGDIPDAHFAKMKDGVMVTRPNRTTAPRPGARERYRKEI